MPTTLVHVGVRASDLEKTIRFWRDGLGLPVFSQMENCYDLSDGYHNFRVFQHNGPQRPPHVSGMLDYLHIGVLVPDLEAAARRLLDMGYEIFSDGLAGDHAVKYQYDARRNQNAEGTASLHHAGYHDFVIPTAQHFR